MSLKYFKSLTECETKNKPKNDKNKAKFKMMYSEMYGISPCKQKKQPSSLQNENPKSELVDENVSELLSKLSCEVIKNKTPKTLKVNSKEIKPHKRKTDASQYLSQKVTLAPKNEKKDKAYPILKRETSNKKKDFVVKQIPLKKNLLEFSIDRSHCPMVVRIHRGYLNKSKTEKGSETLRSRPLTHSQSCPLKIDDQLKINSANRTSQHKKKREKSKCRLMSRGYTICELLNLSPRKSDVRPKDGNLMFTDGNKTDILYRNKILKNKCKLQSNSVNVRMCNCYADSIKYKKKKYLINESTKPQKILVKDMCNEQNTVLAQLGVEDDYNYCNSLSSDMSNNQYISKKYDSFTKIREINVTEDEQFEKEHINEHCDGEAIQMEKSSLVNLKTKVFMMHKSVIDHEKLYRQNHAKGEMSHEMNTYCRKCEKNHVPIKNQTHFIQSHAVPYVPIKVFSNTAYDSPQEGLKTENITAKKLNLLNNVVTLDASQSQFYKISEFLKDGTTYKDNKNTNNNFSKLSLSSQNSSLTFNDQGGIKSTIRKGLTQPGAYEETKKNRSEKLYLNKCTDKNNYNKHSDNEQSGPCLHRPKDNSSLTTSKTYPYETAGTVLFKRLKNNYYSSSYYKCVGCNKVVCKVDNFDPYCSDCKLKNKLSKISDESSSTNSDIELKDRMLPSVKALTVIPESDQSLSKKLVSVAIQTDCDLEQDLQEYGRQNVKPHDTVNITNPRYSSENMFKMYCSIEAQFNKELSPSKIKQSLSRSNTNIDLSYEENLFDGDFQRQNQGPVLESDDHLSEENSLVYLKYNESRRSSSKVEPSVWCIPKSMEPNITNYRENTSNTYVQKYSFTPNENVDKKQVKASLSYFVSPIFPEKEYCRIINNKHTPYPALKSSKETFSISNCKMSDPLHKKYEHKLRSDINIQSRSDENRKTLKHLSIEIETTSPRKDEKSVEGPYISYKKRTTSNEIKTVNHFEFSTEENSYEALNNGLSFCKKGTSIPGCLSRDLSYSVMNIKDSSISLDNNFKIAADTFHKENHKSNTRSTLLGTTKDQNLKYHSSSQSSQFQNLNKDLADFYMTSHTMCTNYQHEPEFIGKQGTNCLNNKMITKRPTSNDGTNSLGQSNCPKPEKYLNNDKSMFSLPFHKPFNLSKVDLSTQFKDIIQSSQVGARGVEGVSQNDHGVTKTFISFRDSKENREYSETNQKAGSCKVGSEITDALELHSFSYIIFNISAHDKENVRPSSDADESYKKHFSFQSGLVLMPEKTSKALDDNLNDIILGSKFKTQINRRLIIKETNIKNSNVFELSSLSKLPKVSTDEGSDCQVCNSEKDHLENRPTIYKAISASTEVNESNTVSEMLQEVDNVILKEKVLDSPLLESDFEKNKTFGRISNNTLKKKKSRNQKEKMTNGNKSKEERNKFMKINNLFMCSYMTQLSFFHDLQSVFKITKNKTCTLK